MAKTEILTPPALEKTDAKPDENTKFCHRFMIPTSVAIPNPNLLKPGTMTLEVRQEMGFVKCIKSKCMRWNDARKDCWDNIDSENQQILADYAEIPSGGGGSGQ